MADLTGHFRLLGGMCLLVHLPLHAEPETEHDPHRPQQSGRGMGSSTCVRVSTGEGYAWAGHGMHGEMIYYNVIRPKQFLAIHAVDLRIPHRRLELQKIAGHPDAEDLAHRAYRGALIFAGSSLDNIRISGGG